MKKTAALFLAAAMLFTAGCSHSQVDYEAAKIQPAEEKEMSRYDEGTKKEEKSISSPALSYAADKPLFTLADTAEEAQKIAGDYGIELVEFSYGVASFYTDKDLKELIEWGRQQGLKPLDINYISELS